MITVRQKIIKTLSPFVRQFATETATSQEVRIPVPWGHIAGKWWGPQDKRPVLCTHGWEDNCGSFDTLIPRLPSHIGYLAIDLPGHGLSSQLSRGVFYHRIDCAIVLKRIIDYFNWSKVSLLGHSMGAIINYQYALLFPESVDFMVNIDGLKPLVQDDRIERMVNIINNFIKYDNLNALKKEPPSYTMEVLEKMLHEGTKKSIALDACKYILKRNVKESTKEAGKFYIVRDARLKALYDSDLLGWAQRDLVETAHRITFPLLATKATHSPFFENKNNLLEVVEVLKKTNQNFEMCQVEGTHHVHLNNPERLEGVICAFIRKHDVADRGNGGMKAEIKA